MDKDPQGRSGPGEESEHAHAEDFTVDGNAHGSAHGSAQLHPTPDEASDSSAHAHDGDLNDLNDPSGAVRAVRAVRASNPVGCQYCGQSLILVEAESPLDGALQRVRSLATCPSCRKAGWTEITRHYYWRLQRYAAKILGYDSDDSDTTDIAQDTLARARGGIQSFEGATTEKFSAWLMRICRNCAVDRGRRRAREKRLLDPKSLEEYWEAAESDTEEAFHALPTKLTTLDFAETVVEQATFWPRFRRAFAMLSPRQQQCFWRCYQEVSYEEIAAELGIKAGAVARYISDARARLVELMWPRDDTRA